MANSINIVVLSGYYKSKYNKLVEVNGRKVLRTLLEVVKLSISDGGNNTEKNQLYYISITNPQIIEILIKSKDGIFISVNGYMNQRDSDEYDEAQDNSMYKSKIVEILCRDLSVITEEPNNIKSFINNVVLSGIYSPKYNKTFTSQDDKNTLRTSIGITRSILDKNGEYINKIYWYKLVVYNQSVIDYLNKLSTGDIIWVNGSLKQREIMLSEDNELTTPHYQAVITEIMCRDVGIIRKKPKEVENVKDSNFFDADSEDDIPF